MALLAAAFLVPAVVFAAMSASHPQMRYWRYLAWCCGSLFVASLLSALRDFLPEMPSTLASNLLVGFGYFNGVRAVRALFAMPTTNHSDVGLLTVYFFLVSFLNLSNSGYELRVFAVSLAIVGFTSKIIAVLYRNQKRINKIGFFLILFVGAMNVFMATARASAALINQEHFFLSLELWDPVFFIGSMIVLFGFSTGYFLIGLGRLSEQTQSQLQRERALSAKLNIMIEDQKNLQKLILHEIKRPINSLYAALQADRIKSDNANTSSQTEALRRLVIEAATVLEALGEYEELSALFENPNMADLPVNSIAEDLITKWRITVHNRAEGSVLRADRLLLDIALGNLIENAQKFGKSKAATTVRIGGTPDHVIFDVEDDGSGIAPSEWDKVWRKFYRVGAPSINSVKGCGLGLHAVESIAELHGGFAKVISQSPSTIRIALPRKFQNDGKS